MFKDIVREKVVAYCQASVPEKTAIITGIVVTTGMQRKTVIRALNRERKRSDWKVSPKLGRPRKYTADCDAALAFIWKEYDYPCAERLHDEITEAINPNSNRLKQIHR